ncbi:hypothetical protein FO519_004665 [Halicephalobus sp. NKZ332]|nr:hypothetical protein FO519_004665 [Halicephalobus sp. NKZ332]
MGVMSGLRHPNVTRIIGINCASALRIITPLRKSDLNAYLLKSNKVDKGDLIRFCVDITDAMIYLHSKNIIHCDLKTSNILIKDEFTVEVADFGLAAIMGDGNGIGGTITHMPIEYLTGKVKHPTKEGDVWSFGVTVWQIFILCKERPYSSENIDSPIKMADVLLNGTRLSTPQLFQNMPSFFATWCGPCKIMGPKFYKMSEEFSNGIFIKVDVDEADDIMAKYEIKVMPTFVFIKNGKVIYTLEGNNPDSLRIAIQERL